MEKQQGLQIDVPHDVAVGTYSNLAIISHSHSEFIIDFASMMPGTDKPVVRSRIVMSPEHAKRLLIALQDNVTKYESNNGQIALTNKHGATFDMGNFGGNGNGPIS